MRWKAFFFDNTDTAKENHQQNFGFKTENCPPQHHDLTGFERDLYELARNIDFKERAGNSFQNKLAADVRNIKNSKALLIPADKTTNLYKVNVKDYQKLVNDNVCSTYKKANSHVVHEINTEAKSIASKLDLENNQI